MTKIGDQDERNGEKISIERRLTIPEQTENNQKKGRRKCLTIDNLDGIDERLPDNIKGFLARFIRERFSIIKED